MTATLQHSLLCRCAPACTSVRGMCPLGNLSIPCCYARAPVRCPHLQAMCLSRTLRCGPRSCAVRLLTGLQGTVGHSSASGLQGTYASFDSAGYTTVAMWARLSCRNFVSVWWQKRPGGQSILGRGAELRQPYGLL